MGVKIKSALGSVTLDAENIASNTTVTVPAGGGTLADTGVTDALSTRVNAVGGRKNLIMNGAMNVAQRATSKTGVTSSGYHTLDRWGLDNSGLGTFTMSKVADAPAGFRNSLKLDCTTAYGSTGADDFNAIRYKLESQDTGHLDYGAAGAKSVTVSFWVKCSQAGDLQFNLLHYADAGTRQISSTYTINTADTWEKKTITFAGDTVQAGDDDNTQGLYLEWFLASGSNRNSGTMQTTWGAYTLAARNSDSTISIGDSTADTYQITGVQLELGDTATDFEHRSYGEELALCRRYYQRLSGGRVAQGYAVSSTETYSFINYPTQFRVHPTLIINNHGKVVREGVAWYTNTASQLLAESTINSGVLNNYQSSNSMSFGDGMMVGQGADYGFDAEL